MGAMIDAFVPKAFRLHMERVRQLDGGGLRLDADFKMAKPIRQAVWTNSGETAFTSPSQCLLAVRGVRGFFLAALTPEISAEGGMGYFKLIDAICADRVRMCGAEPGHGIPDSLAFDNGPAYERYGLAALGKHWPMQIHAAPQPPGNAPVQARLSPCLRGDVVPVASDPPHRRWSSHKELNNSHPDFKEID